MKTKKTTGPAPRRVAKADGEWGVREFHLFAGIGGGIYGGELLGHRCCGGVEIMPYAQRVLKQRQKDGWMPEFPIYGDLRKVNGGDFRGSFDVLCGGFPCQAFSTAAHGANIAEKNLWDEMLRFVKESDSPIVFGENVVLRAIERAKSDLEEIGYKVERVRLGCADIGADHQRNRFWLLAVKDADAFSRIAKHIVSLPRLTANCWKRNPETAGRSASIGANGRRERLLGVGNAQSPLAAATAFRILVNRHLRSHRNEDVVAHGTEISAVFEMRRTWIQETFDEIGLVHTPTTMANYACPSMMKHQGCRNFVKVFGRPEPWNAEYLMGFPLGASSPDALSIENFNVWKKGVTGNDDAT